MNSPLPGEIAEYLVKQSQATHRMTPQDLSVWNEFQGMITGQYAFMRYDIRLGPGRPAPEGSGAHEKAMWTALTQYRCDTAIVAETEAWLMEIKPVVTHAMLGQLLAYDDALMTTPLFDPSVKLVGLARTGNSHVEALARQHGLTIVTLDNPRGLFVTFGTLMKLP